MKTWNIGNTTVRNPQRLLGALRVFVNCTTGRAFDRNAQTEFLLALVNEGLVDSDRVDDGSESDSSDGGRKFGSAFKQLGFVTDWSHGKSWSITAVGQHLIQHEEVQETIFLRQLLKYQIPSPLEPSAGDSFRIRPFRLLLRFLRRAHTEGMVGLTKHEMGLYVVTVLTEDDETFEEAFQNIRTFREGYNAETGRVAKDSYANSRMNEVAAARGLKAGTLRDYADSNSRYSLMSGLLTLRGNKLAVAEARLPLTDAILSDGTSMIPDEEYLQVFYNPALPELPTDRPDFLAVETADLLRKVEEVSVEIGIPHDVPAPTQQPTMLQLQAYEQRLRNILVRLREVKFYRSQNSVEALEDIEEWLINIRDRKLVGGAVYAPAYLEWAIWRLFLSMNELTGEISDTRGFKVDEDIHPTHHAKGGAADLIFTYNDFKLVCEMTLMGGSRQFAAEAEPVTRHVYKAILESDGVTVYGLFIAKNIDPNTVDAFHNARYFKNWQEAVSTPVIALQIDHILALIARSKISRVRMSEFRQIMDDMLARQTDYQSGPAWCQASWDLFDNWVTPQ